MSITSSSSSSLSSRTTKQQYNEGTLVQNISYLCGLDKKFHTGRREKEIKSLTRYMTEFKNFSEGEFINFICRHYIKSLRECKRFCSQSIFNRISAIQNRMDINVISMPRYASVIKSLRKLFNPYCTDNEFYTNTGCLVQMPAHEFQQLRQNARQLMEQNDSNVPDRWSLNTYTDKEIEIVYRYFKLNLVNFINATKVTKYDIAFIELAMIIVFAYNTPRRISEIINLRLYQAEELINKNTVNIKSKDGYSVDCIYVSVALADLLNRFILRLYPNIFDTGNDTADPNFKIFTSTYKVYYNRMRNTLKMLIGEDRLKNLRIFHGFRNYFANKQLNEAGDDKSKAVSCQMILGHSNLGMTKKYAQRQRRIKQFKDVQTKRILNYLNKSQEKF